MARYNPWSVKLQTRKKRSSALYHVQIQNNVTFLGLNLSFVAVVEAILFVFHELPGGLNPLDISPPLRYLRPQSPPTRLRLVHVVGVGVGFKRSAVTAKGMRTAAASVTPRRDGGEVYRHRRHRCESRLPPPVHRIARCTLSWRRR